MPKIKNELLAGREAYLSTEAVKFDTQGIAEVKSQEVYDEIVKLPNFSAVEEAPVEEPEVEEVKEEPKKEVKPTKTTKK